MGLPTDPKVVRYV